MPVPRSPRAGSTPHDLVQALLTLRRELPQQADRLLSHYPIVAPQLLQTLLDEALENAADALKATGELAEAALLDTRR